MFGVLTTLTLSIAIAQDHGVHNESSKAIGVWNFSIVSDAQLSEQDRLQATLEERTKAVLPLIKQHTELKLITPEKFANLRSVAGRKSSFGNQSGIGSGLCDHWKSI